jgi:glycosyltransferase involved in cell wall biosynthesis
VVAVSGIEVPENAAIRVLHLDTGGTWRGGQQQVYLLHRELRSMGVESGLAARTGGDLEKRCLGHGLPVWSLGGCRPWHLSTWSVLRSAARETHIVHVHDSHAAELSLIARLFNPRLQIVLHRRVSYPLRGRLSRRLKYRRVDLWIAASSEIAGGLEGSGVARDRIRVLHSALDVEGFRSAAAATDQARLRRQLGIDERTPVVILVAAIESQKGHRVLLDAAPRILSEVPDAVILCVGDGSARGDLENEVEAAGWSSRFRFIGFRRDVAGVTAMSSVAVAPSLDGEGSSASLKEAMALGRAIVASRLAGNREVVGDAARLVPPGDPHALADAVVALLEDGDERRRLGELAASRVDRFRPRALCEGMVEIYRELRANGSASSEAA